jgi:tetratricopeptide (TPR) repeat protein
MTERTIYEFGAFRFVAEKCLLLRRDNKPLKIPKQKKESFEVKLGRSLCPLLLAFLSKAVEHGSHEIILLEEDLIKAAWPASDPNDPTAKSTLTRTLFNLKKILKDNDPRERAYIESAGGGHKFIRPVEKMSASEIMDPHAPPVDPKKRKEAEREYGWGRQLLDEITTEDGLQRAITHFQQAHEIVPHFAEAYAHEALAHMWLIIFSWRTPQDSLPEALRASEQALRLDKRLGVAYAAKALAVLFSESERSKRWKEAEVLLEKAVELDQKHDQRFEAVYQVCALMQTARGQSREADLTIERSLEIKAASYISNVLKALVQFFSRNYQCCDDLLQKLLSEGLNIDAAYYIGVLVCIYKGDPDKALKEIDQGEKMAKGNILYRLLLAYWNAIWGSVDKAVKLLEELDVESKRRYISPYHRALPYVHINRLEAIERLERAALEQDPWVLLLKVDPRVDFLRRDERFIKLLHELGPDVN